MTMPHYLYQLLFSFKGRINRLGFWLGAAMYCFLNFVLWGPVLLTAAYVFHLPDQLSIWDAWRVVGFLGVFVPTLVFSFWAFFAIGTKRLHDRGRQGAWMLLFLLPYWTYNAVAARDFYHGTKEWAPWITTGLGFAAIAALLWGLVELGVLPGMSGANRFDVENPVIPMQG